MNEWMNEFICRLVWPLTSAAPLWLWRFPGCFCSCWSFACCALTMLAAAGSVWPAPVLIGAPGPVCQPRPPGFLSQRLWAAAALACDARATASCGNWEQKILSSQSERRSRRPRRDITAATGSLQLQLTITWFYMNLSYWFRGKYVDYLDRNYVVFWLFSQFLKNKIK